MKFLCLHLSTRDAIFNSDVRHSPRADWPGVTINMSHDWFPVVATSRQTGFVQVQILSQEIPQFNLLKLGQTAVESTAAADIQILGRF